MPFAAPPHHRCAAFDKVCFRALCRWEGGRRKGGRRGRELVRCDHCPLLPSIHRVMVVMTVRVRYYILPPSMGSPHPPPGDPSGDPSGGPVAACSPLYVVARTVSQITWPSPPQIGTLPSGGAGFRAFGRIVSIGGVQMGCRWIKTRSTALQNRDFPIFSPVLTRVSEGRWSKVGLHHRFCTHNFVALTRA